MEHWLNKAGSWKKTPSI